MKIILHCCLCEKKHESIVKDAQGWGNVETLEKEWAFCPDHAIIEQFKDSQCPGCVAGWGDCPLWQGFAYQRRRNLTELDFSMIRTGICPKRVNGTITFSRKEGMVDINISERSPMESGIALEKAIKDYWKRYPE